MKKRFMSIAITLALSCSLAQAAGPGGSTSVGGRSQTGSMAPSQTGQSDLIDAASASAHILQLRNYIHRHMLQQRDFGVSQRLALLRKYGVNDGESAMVDVGDWANADLVTAVYVRNEHVLGQSLINLLVKGHPNFIHKSVLDQLDRQVTQLMQMAPQVDALTAQSRELEVQIAANGAKMKAPVERKSLLSYSYGTAALRCRGMPDPRAQPNLCVLLIGTVHTPNSEFLRTQSGADPAVDALNAQNFKLRGQQAQTLAQLKALDRIVVTTMVTREGGAMPPPPSAQAQDVPPDGRPD